MKNKTIVTIITIVRNDPEGFLATANSVLQQDYERIEWLVIDGLSTDSTSHYVRSLLPAISDCKIEKDSGIYNAMNKGIDMASGGWIIFMNAGDVFYKKTTVSEYIDNLNEDDDIVYSDVVSRETERIHHYRPLEQFWAGMILDHQTACVRAEIYKKLKYNENYHVAGDFDFLSRARINGYRFRKIQWLIGCRKPFSIGASSSFVDRQRERVVVLQKYFDIYPWRPLLRREFEAAERASFISSSENDFLSRLLEI